MPKAKHPIRRFLAALGPGVITGAADDDPSGIATYSIAGAQFGTAFLWTALLTWPLMAVVQMTCARIGMVTGRGLARVLHDRFPRWLLILLALGLLAANSLNVAADLAGMADAAGMVTGISSHYYVGLFAILIVTATIALPYRRIATVLKWLALALCAYVITALLLRPHWGKVLHDTLTPSLPRTKDGWSTLVALLGTTISPYLFFWQSAEEVEEEKALGRITLARRKGATREELLERKLDVGFGTFSSILVMFFVMLTTALPLHLHGQTHIQTSAEAASALRPFAGDFAAALYTVGIFGVGFLAIPTLAGSSAPPRLVGLRHGRHLPLAPGARSEALAGARVLFDHHPLHRGRRGAGPLQSQRHPHPVLVRDHQRPARPLPAGRHPDRRRGPESDAGPTEPAPLSPRGRLDGPVDARRRCGDARLLR